MSPVQLPARPRATCFLLDHPALGLLWLGMRPRDGWPASRTSIGRSSSEGNSRTWRIGGVSTLIIICCPTGMSAHLPANECRRGATGPGKIVPTLNEASTRGCLSSKTYSVIWSNYSFVIGANSFIVCNLKLFDCRFNFIQFKFWNLRESNLAFILNFALLLIVMRIRQWWSLVSVSHSCLMPLYWAKVLSGPVFDFMSSFSYVFSWWAWFIVRAFGSSICNKTL